MKEDKQEIIKVLKSFFEKKPYYSNSLYEKIKNVPIPNIYELSYDYFKNNLQLLGFTPNPDKEVLKTFWENLSLDEKKKIEKRMKAENEKISESMIIIEKYLLRDYHPPHLTTKEFFIAQKVREFIRNDTPYPYEQGRIEGDLEWSMMKEKKRKYWKLLKKINDKHWNVIHFNKEKLAKDKKWKHWYSENEMKYFKGKGKLFEKYGEFRLNLFLLEIMSKKKTSYFNPAGSFSIYQCLKGYETGTEMTIKDFWYKSKTLEKLSQEDKVKFEKFCYIEKLRHKYCCLIKEKGQYIQSIRKITPKILFYYNCKDEILGEKGQIKGKIKKINEKWKNLTLEEKNQYTIEANEMINNIINGDTQSSNQGKEVKPDNMIVHYIKLKFSEYKTKFPQLTKREIIEILFKQWNSLDNKVKSQFIKKTNIIKENKNKKKPHALNEKNKKEKETAIDE